jgi:hypothetical protein
LRGLDGKIKENGGWMGGHILETLTKKEMDENDEQNLD